MLKILLVVSAIFLLISCSDNQEQYQSNGEITGYDMRKCMCCGGWYILINEHTYRFYKIPDGSDLNLDSLVFPVLVRLDWKAKDTTCLGDEIDIIRIRKR